MFVAVLGVIAALGGTAMLAGAGQFQGMPPAFGGIVLALAVLYVLLGVMVRADKRGAALALAILLSLSALANLGQSNIAGFVVGAIAAVLLWMSWSAPGKWQKEKDQLKADDVENVFG